MIARKAKLTVVKETASDNNISLTTPVGGIAIGDFIITVTIGLDGGNDRTITPSDDKTNTWQNDAHVKPFEILQISSCKVTTALVSGDLITSTFSAAVTDKIMFGYVYSGLDATSWADASKTATDITGTSSAADTGLTSTVTKWQNELLIGAACLDHPTTFTPAIGLGWTQLDIDDNGASHDCLVACERFVYGTDTYKFAGTWGGADVWGAAIATYKGAFEYRHDTSAFPKLSLISQGA